MNKDKYVKELTRLLCEFEKLCCKGECEGCKIQKLCALPSTAKFLYNAGYRKVPVNAAGVAEKAQCKDLQRIIEEERELQGNIGDDVMDMLIASAIYAEGYRKVPIGSVIVSIEEREAIEKQIEELQGNGTEFETKIIKLIEQAKVFFDAGVRSKAEYTAFRQVLDVCTFALNTQKYINEVKAEIERLKAENANLIEDVKYWQRNG